MRRAMAGGAASVLAGAGLVALGGPLGAQAGGDPAFETETLEASLEPSTVAPGETVTVTSGDPCDPLEGMPESVRTMSWALVDSDEFSDWESALSGGADISAAQQGEAPLNDDGSWSVTVTAPSESGTYDFVGFCVVDFEVPEAQMDEAADQLGRTGPPVTATTIPDITVPSTSIPDVTLPPSTETTTTTVPSTTTTTTTVPSTTTTAPVAPGDITVGLYGPLELTVEDDGSGGDDGDDDPVAPPAVPVPGDPEFTG